jgi:hypothetical protein
LVLYALQPAEVDFINDVRALTDTQRGLLYSMARKLSHDVTPVVVLAPTDNVTILFPEFPDADAPESRTGST